MEPLQSTPVVLILTDQNHSTRHRDNKAVGTLAGRRGRPTVELGELEPAELERALTTAPIEGQLVASSSRPSMLLAAARTASIPTMLMLRVLDSDELDALATEVTAAEADGVPVAGWLPNRFDPRSLSVDAALGADHLGGIVASRIVRLEGRRGAPVYDLIDLLDLAMRWHNRLLTSIIALTARAPAGGGAAVRFADAGSALLEWGNSTELPDAGYDETLLIGRTGTLDLPWEVQHESRVGKDGACPTPLVDTDELLARWLLNWTTRPTAVTAAAPAHALVAALRVAQAHQRSAASGNEITLTGTPSGGAR